MINSKGVDPMCSYETRLEVFQLIALQHFLKCNFSTRSIKAGKASLFKT